MSLTPGVASWREADVDKSPWQSKGDVGLCPVGLGQGHGAGLGQLPAVCLHLALDRGMCSPKTEGGGTPQMLQCSCGTGEAHGCPTGPP